MRVPSSSLVAALGLWATTTTALATPSTGATSSLEPVIAARSETSGEFLERRADSAASKLADAALGIFLGEGWNVVSSLLGFGGDSPVTLAKESIDEIVNRVESKIKAAVDDALKRIGEIDAAKFFNNVKFYAPTDNDLQGANGAYHWLEQSGDIAIILAETGIGLSSTHYWQLAFNIRLWFLGEVMRIREALNPADPEIFNLKCKIQPELQTAIQKMDYYQQKFAEYTEQMVTKSSSKTSQKCFEGRGLPPCGCKKRTYTYSWYTKQKQNWDLDSSFITAWSATCKWTDGCGSSNTCASKYPDHPDQKQKLVSLKNQFRSLHQGNLLGAKWSENRAKFLDLLNKYKAEATAAQCANVPMSVNRGSAPVHEFKTFDYTSV